MNLILILLPWVLSACLGWRQEKLRRTVRKLKKRIKDLEHATADGEVDWGYYGDDGDDE